MLKGLPPFMGPDLLWLLAAMGHGDQLVIVDRNFPALSTASLTRSGRCVELPGVDMVSAFRGILQLLPLDTFIETPIWRMQSVDQPNALVPVQADVLAECERAEGRPVAMGSIERFAFYEAAKRCYGVVHTTESRPYGCFIVTKGVVFDA